MQAKAMNLFNVVNIITYSLVFKYLLTYFWFFRGLLLYIKFKTSILNC